ncbi:hypothetical protein AgCh_036685 [Apium graveolens]
MFGASIRECDVGGGLVLERIISLPKDKLKVVQFDSRIIAHNIGVGSGGFSRYALDVNVERAKDVIVHKKLLNVAHDPATRIDSSTLFIFCNEECLKVELVDSVITSELDQLLRSDALEKALLGNSDNEYDEAEEQLQYLNASPWKRKIDISFESLGMEELNKVPKRLKPSIEEAPTLELKPLPGHLRYAFLGDASTLSVIIASDLSGSDEEKLLRILREFKLEIGWTIADIKGISPSYCMHKILIEEDSKPTVEQQRRLNLIMKEVVKKKNS